MSIEIKPDGVVISAEGLKPKGVVVDGTTHLDAGSRQGRGGVEMSKPNVTFERKQAGRYRIYEHGELAGSIRKQGDVWCWLVVDASSVCRDGWDCYLYAAKMRAAAALQQAQDGEATV